MPDENLKSLPGFFGKIPAAGDFVGRRLDPAFVRRWDGFISRHLALPLTAMPDEAAVPLRFLAGSEPFGAMTGIVVPSIDRAGRRFPLTLAAVPQRPVASLAVTAAPWFAALDAAAQAALDGALDADQLAAALARLPLPEAAAAEATVEGLLMWTDPGDLRPLDPAEPGLALTALLAGLTEAG